MSEVTEVNGAVSGPLCSLTTAFLDTGIIMYAISDEIDTVTIYRILWSEW